MGDLESTDGTMYEESWLKQRRKLIKFGAMTVGAIVTLQSGQAKAAWQRKPKWSRNDDPQAAPPSGYQQGAAY